MAPKLRLVSKSVVVANRRNNGTVRNIPRRTDDWEVTDESIIDEILKNDLEAVMSAIDRTNGQVVDDSRRDILPREVLDVGECLINLANRPMVHSPDEQAAKALVKASRQDASFALRQIDYDHGVRIFLKKSVRQIERNTRHLEYHEETGHEVKYRPLDSDDDFPEFFDHNWKIKKGGRKRKALSPVEDDDDDSTSDESPSKKVKVTRIRLTKPKPPKTKAMSARHIAPVPSRITRSQKKAEESLESA